MNDLLSLLGRWLPVVVESVTGLLALLGLGYYCAALLAARAYAGRVRRVRAAQDAAGLTQVSADDADLRLAPQGTFHAPVSVLKPLRGVDAGMVEAFVSHCRQDYAGAYELVFGAHPDDAGAHAVVRRLQVEFPERAITLVECAETLGPNGKVSTLAQMVASAQYDYFVINDSDIFVGPDYLRRVMAEFGDPVTGLADPGVGMVTAFYSGRCVADARAAMSVWAKIEALTVSTEFVPGAILAMQMDGGIKFALGGTLAIRREVLEEIGGFLGMVDSLADDYEMGIRTIAAGFRVAMAATTVETAVPSYSFRQYAAHQLRWLRTVRDARPWGYAGLPFSFGLLWAVVAVIASAGAVWSWPLLSMALLARLALGLSVGVGVLQDGQVLRDFWLIPLRDGMGAWMWVWSFAGDEVEWRGMKFHLRKGKLVRM